MTPLCQKAPWYRQAAKLIPKHMILKSIGTTVFISLFFVAYFHVLRYPVYLSLWLYASMWLRACPANRAILHNAAVST